MKSKYKHRQKKKREEKKKQKIPEVKISIWSTDPKFKEDFITATIGKIDVIGSFWREIPAKWRNALINHRNRTRKLHSKDIEYFKQTSSGTLRRVVQKATTLIYPKYNQYNYSFDVMPDRRLFHYGVFLDALEVQSTPNGTAHLLPDFRYPSNKKLGLTTHAIEQMDSRLFEDVSDKQASILRAPTFIIPYKKDIYALYCALPATSICTFNGVSIPFYMLLGYLPIEDRGDLLIGVTHLKPGYRQTPESKIPQEDINNSRILVIVDNQIHRISDIDSDKAYTTIPYDIENPHIDLLLKIQGLLT